MTKSTISEIDALYKFAKQFAKAGGTPTDLNALAESKALLLKVLALSPVKKDFSVWRKVTLGRHKSVQAFQESILAKGCKMTDSAKDLMSKSSLILAQEEREVSLVKASAAELGYPERATLGEILQAANDRGWEKCPAEVGLALREQYLDQPEGEYLVVAMEPIANSDGDPDLFGVNRDGGEQWLNVHYGFTVDEWDGGHTFVFVLPGK